VRNSISMREKFQSRLSRSFHLTNAPTLRVARSPPRIHESDSGNESWGRSIWMWVGPVNPLSSPPPSPAPPSAKQKHGARPCRSVPFDRPEDASFARRESLWDDEGIIPRALARERGNARYKRSGRYSLCGVYTATTTMTLHPVELLRSEQCAAVDKDVLTLALERGEPLGVVVGYC